MGTIEQKKFMACTFICELMRLQQSVTSSTFNSWLEPLPVLPWKRLQQVAKDGVANASEPYSCASLGYTEPGHDFSGADSISKGNA